MAPSTFASAAAGNPHAPTTTRDATSEWTRRNGATQTFRRASGATTATTMTPSANSHNVDPLAAAAAAAAASSLPARYVPPHRNGTLADTRYTRDQLVDLYKVHQSSKESLHSLFLAGWQPDGTNGPSTPWTRPDPNRDVQQGAEVCWDGEASIAPLAVIEMDEEERDLFITSVNTPIKPANLNKDNQSTNASGGRKSSISASATTPGPYGLPSPGLTRGQGRRRDTSDSYPFPPNSSTSAGGFGRDDQRAASPPPSLVRRRTDLKDQNRLDERDEEDKPTASPFGSLRRNPTIGSGFGAPSSPWTTGPQSAGLSPMGTFGNFGLGTTGQASTPGISRPGLGSGRTESRFKNFVNKDPEEGVSRDVERKASVASLAKVHEHDARHHDLADLDDTLAEAEESAPAGSAALSADAEASPEHRQIVRGLGTPSRDGYGFGAFGMHQTPHHQRTGPGGGNEAMSPTDTNPYQSPEPLGLERGGEEGDAEATGLQSAHLPGLGGFPNDTHYPTGLGNLGAPNRTVRGPGDRSQTSSVGPNRGFPSLGGLGQLGGVSGSAAWPVTSGGLGTPGRQTAGLAGNFSSGLFGNPIGDLQSPGGLAGLGGPGLLGSAGGFGSSRMASVFPQGMQDQMRQQDEQDILDRAGATPFAGLGDLGRPIDSGFKPSAFVDGPGDQIAEPSLSQFGAHSLPDLAPHQGQNPPAVSSASNQPPAPQQRTMVMPDRMRWIYRDPQGQTQGPWSGLEMHDWYKAGFFSPELLVKKYEDPDYEPLAQLIRRIGNSREPFLVPQIGIPHGAPSGSGPNAWAGSGTIAGGAASSTGGAQPPFASSFPSFGTTLTADQQNALERRKQEEQYLMARQKEHLAQAQMSQRYQMQGGHLPMPGQLHHHSSAHSLHSQPSFGSVTSPIGAGYQASPLQAPSVGSALSHQPGFFDNSFRAPQMSGPGAVGSGIDSLSQIREEEIPSIMDRLSLGAGRSAINQFGAPGQQFGAQQQLTVATQDSHEKQVQQMLQDRARLQQEQAQHDALHEDDDDDDDDDEADSMQRLKEFERFQGHEPSIDDFQTGPGKPIVPPVSQVAQAQQSSATQSSLSSPVQEPIITKEQHQKEHVSKQSQTLPQPFPVPVVAKPPLAAPEPQRPGRPIVAEHLQLKEPRDRSETPSVESKIAPWATKDPEVVLKGPSLKEIQEMEAKKAARDEELAIAARRAALQKAMEAEAQALAAAVITPGLPAASNWATGSPSTPVGASAPMPWAKTTIKATGSTAPAKSMAQIQKEEENRKKKLAAAALANAQANGIASVASSASGKSYANLAGKIGPTIAIPSGNVAGGAWTTVGAGGKTKTPITAAAPSPVTGRAASTSAGPTASPTGTIKKTPSRTGSSMLGTSAANPTIATSATITSNSVSSAQDEFKKWAANELRAELSKGIAAEDFVSSLTMLPADMDILTEAVHGASSTLDSRHFAEEFLRRKKLADKGLFDGGASAGIAGKSGFGAGVSGGKVGLRNGHGGVTSEGRGGAGGSGSGWSEVAKKGGAGSSGAGGAKEAGEVNGSGTNGMFKVVPAKKKGGKR